MNSQCNSKHHEHQPLSARLNFSPKDRATPTPAAQLPCSQGELHGSQALVHPAQTVSLCFLGIDAEAEMEMEGGVEVSVSGHRAAVISVEPKVAVAI